MYLTLVSTLGTIFAKVTIFFGDWSGLFFAWAFAGQLGVQLWAELDSLINQELSMYPIRTVFNYSANFNVVGAIAGSN